MQNLLSLLEKVLSWPVMTLVTILLFRKPLLDLLNRLSTLKVGKDLFCIDAPLPTIQSEKSADTGLESKTSLIEQAKYGESPIVHRYEELIQQDLKKLQLDVNPQEAVNILVRHLALAQLLNRAEVIYRTIFGSQIALLKQLNIIGSMAREQVESFYNIAKAQFSLLYDTYSFDEYLHFLEAFNLIQTNDNKKYIITDEGKAFLQWMIGVGANEIKPF
jgi:predicted transcriptional regulator